MNDNRGLNLSPEAIAEFRTAERLDGLLEELGKHVPESWESDVATESILVDYVREIERRLVALGGTLEHLPVMGTSTVADRRAEAREAFLAHEDVTGQVGTRAAVDAALTLATQVRITPKAVGMVSRAVNRLGANHGYDAGLAAALTELGFEVKGES